MYQDHQRVWLPDNGSPPFFFTGKYSWRADMADDEARRRLSTADTPGSDGEYSEPDAPRDVRVISLRGWFNCKSLTELLDCKDTLTRGVRAMKPGKLVRRVIDPGSGTILRSRYIRCVPNAVALSGQSGLPNARWEISMRTLGDKVCYYDEQASTLPLNVPAASGIATTPLNLGGVEEVLPRIVFQVQSIGTGGSITVSHNFADGFARFAPDAPGAWTLDFDPDSPGQALTVAGLSQMGAFSGSFPPFIADPSQLTLIVGGQVVVSSAQIIWRPRYLFSS